MKPDRKLVQDIYIRICRDSGFQLGYVEAAKLAANVGGFHPLDVADALGIANMHEIATGRHPVCQRLSAPPSHGLGMGG